MNVSTRMVRKVFEAVEFQQGREFTRRCVASRAKVAKSPTLCALLEGWVEMGWLERYPRSVGTIPTFYYIATEHFPLAR